MNELHFAVFRNNLDEVRKILSENPALINSLDRNHNTALHWAARSGNIEIINELLSHSEIDPTIRNVNPITKFQDSIAVVAAKYGHSKLAQDLLAITNRKSTETFVIVDESNQSEEDWDIIVPTQTKSDIMEFEDSTFSTILEDFNQEEKTAEDFIGNSHSEHSANTSYSLAKASASALENKSYFLTKK